MIKAGIKEARQHFTQYLRKVQDGEEIIITNREEPIARIVPIRKETRGKLLNHKALRDSILSKGKPLSEIVADSRKGERY